jgi:hypothetical protein
MISKNDILDYYFGDLARYLLKEYRIAPLLIPCIIFCLLIYFLTIYKHKKGTDYNDRDKVLLILAIIMIICTVIMQVFASIGWWAVSK